MEYTKFRDTLEGVSKKMHYKSSKRDSEKQEFIPIYKNMANPEAVKLEIGDVIEAFNEEIKAAKKEVDERRAEKPVKYSQRAFYSQDLNATIKERLLKRMMNDVAFNNRIRVRKNSGSTYFIVKDKYILYVKRLYGNFNKPNSYPTPNSERLFNGTLFPGENDHIPVLFIGPNLGNLNETSAFVTSLISRYEVNWSLISNDLFSTSEVISLTPISKEVKEEKEIVKLKKGLGKPDHKQG
ncbi:hypothetical protein [Flavobacterium sp.]|uniref:hypothetical protein n=1 Tax=Flavobacterium sp. TaxID=239 RepID=UPI002605AC8D|nr:hypothetical protein [Flavobacterium sp.]